MYLRDYPEGTSRFAGPQRGAATLMTSTWLNQSFPSAITTEAVPWIVIFDLDQYVHGMLVQTDVSSKRQRKAFEI
jgi:hypothetical protein